MAVPRAVRVAGTRWAGAPPLNVKPRITRPLAVGGSRAGGDPARVPRQPRAGGGRCAHCGTELAHGAGLTRGYRRGRRSHTVSAHPTGGTRAGGDGPRGTAVEAGPARRASGRKLGPDDGAPGPRPAQGTVSQRGPASAHKVGAGRAGEAPRRPRRGHVRARSTEGTGRPIGRPVGAWDARAVAHGGRPRDDGERVCRATGAGHQGTRGTHTTTLLSGALLPEGRGGKKDHNDTGRHKESGYHSKHPNE